MEHLLKQNTISKDNYIGHLTSSRRNSVLAEEIQFPYCKSPVMMDIQTTLVHCFRRSFNLQSSHKMSPLLWGLIFKTT